jgi:hypothetical protein
VTDGERTPHASSHFAAMWDQIIAAFLDGGPAVPRELEHWFDGYRGRGHGEVTVEAFPEPYVAGTTRPHAGASSLA